MRAAFFYCIIALLPTLPALAQETLGFRPGEVYRYEMGGQGTDIAVEYRVIAVYQDRVEIDTTTYVRMVEPADEMATTPAFVAVGESILETYPYEVDLSALELLGTEMLEIAGQHVVCQKYRSIEGEQSMTIWARQGWPMVPVAIVKIEETLRVGEQAVHQPVLTLTRVTQPQ